MYIHTATLRRWSIAYFAYAQEEVWGVALKNADAGVNEYRRRCRGGRHRKAQASAMKHRQGVGSDK